MATWNPSDKSAGFTLSEANLRATATSGGNIGVRATSPQTAGKYYAEYLAHADFHSYYDGPGVVRPDVVILDNVYAGTNGVSVGNNGGIQVNGTTVVSGYVSGGTGHVYRQAFDRDAQLFWSSFDGGNWNNDPTANPATGTGGIDVSGTGSIHGNAAVPYIASSTGNPDFTARFAAADWTYSAPSGFGEWAGSAGGASSDAAASAERASDEAASSDYLLNAFWNAATKSAEITLTNNNLTAQTNAGASGAGVRATLGHKSGKKYFEYHIDEINGANQLQLFGIAPGSISLSDFGGAYNGTQTPAGAFIQMGFHDGGGHFQLRDITIGVAVDFRLRQCRFKVRIGNAGYTGDWTWGGRQFAKGLQFPTLLLTDSGISDILKPTIIANFGAQTFQFAIPDGFAAWDGQQGADFDAESLYKGTIAIGGGFVSTTTQMIATSRDAITFTMRTTPQFTGGSGVDYNLVANTRVFVGVSYSSTDAARAAVVSSDGITWTPATAAENNSWNGVCYAPEIPLFVAVSSDGTNRVMTSPDGQPGNWTARSVPGSARSWRSVCWSPEAHMFVAVANNGGGLSDTIMSSPDGINWTLRTSPADRTWENVIWVPTWGEIPSSGSASFPTGLFVASPIGATGGHPDYATSPNGIDWTGRDSGTSGSGWRMLAWSVDTDRVCAVTHGGTINYTDDGVTWGSVSVGSYSFDGVGWSRVGQCFIALASGGEIFTSPDAITWTELSEPASRSWHSFAEKLDHVDTPSSALDSFLLEHPSSSFVGGSPSSSAGAASDHASERASSDALAHERASSDHERASSDKPAHDAASSDAAADQEAGSSSNFLDHEENSSDAEHAIPPPIQVVTILS